MIHSMRLLCYLVLCITLTTLMTPFSGNASSLTKADYHFAAIENLAEQEIGKIVLTRIYQELGLNIDITSFAGNRAQHEANSGLKAGEIMRIWTYGNENKNLIRVPTAYYSLTTSAFKLTNNPIQINKASDLKGYNIVRIRGVKHTNNITNGLRKISDSPSTVAMFKLLLQGNVDIALTNYIDGIEVLKKLNLENEIVASKPLAELKLYHYIHKDHRDLVSKVDNMIKQLKSTGQLAEIIMAAEAAVLDEHLRVKSSQLTESSK